MELVWQDSKCIICLEQAKLTEEHVIPASLGGRLTCRFLCASCNSYLGHAIEGNAKSDPTIQLLGSRLASKIPQLAKALMDGQPHISLGPGGESRGRIVNGEFLVQSEKLSDGSLIQPTSVATKSLRRMLEQEKLDPSALTDALQMFQIAPDNIRIRLTENIEAVKWSIHGYRPALDGPLLNPVAPLKMAYEFLALHLNTSIYDSAPCLMATREALRGEPMDLTQLKVERLSAPEAKPIHGLLLESSEPYTMVQIRLMGQLAFRVHFQTLSVGGPRGIYTHDLASDQEFVAQAA
ncbi:HNH endonuclease [Acidovorax sp.]|uniref:HNH endonuclease n=1 Tax=Acidovorax sp. TaxID=1872122 RepID=UPI003D01ABA4